MLSVDGDADAAVENKIQMRIRAVLFGGHSTGGALGVAVQAKCKQTGVTMAKLSLSHVYLGHLQCLTCRRAVGRG